MSQTKPNFRSIVQHFVPSWFALVMGTAVAVPAFASFQKIVPFASVFMLFFLTVAFVAFVLILIPWLLRWAWFREAAVESLKHPVSAAFYPTMPISLVVGGIALEKAGSLFLPEKFLNVTLQTLLVAGATGILLLAIIILSEFFQKPDLPWGSASLGWLIPPVSTLIVPLLSFSLAERFEGTVWHGINVVGGLIFTGLGFFLFMFMMATIFVRYLFHQLPPAQLLPTFWIGLAPTSILTIISLKSVPALAGYFETPETVTQVLTFFSKTLGIGLWGFAFFWLLLSIWFTLAYTRKSALDFALSWWAFIFPLGAFTVATGVLYTSIQLNFFLWVGIAALAGFLLLWGVVFMRTLQGTWSGKLFIPHG